MQTLEELPAVLLVSEVADVLRLDRQTVYLMVERKALRASRVGRGTRSIRIEKAEVIRFMREGASREGRAA